MANLPHTWRPPGRLVREAARQVLPRLLKPLRFLLLSELRTAKVLQHAGASNNQHHVNLSVLINNKQHNMSALVLISLLVRMLSFKIVSVYRYPRQRQPRCAHCLCTSHLSWQLQAVTSHCSLTSVSTQSNSCRRLTCRCMHARVRQLFGRASGRYVERGQR